MTPGTIIATNLFENSNVGFALDNGGDVGSQGIEGFVSFDNQWETIGNFSFSYHLRPYQSSNSTTKFWLRSVNPSGPGSSYYPDNFINGPDPQNPNSFIDYAEVESNHISFVDNPMFGECPNSGDEDDEGPIEGLEYPGYTNEFLKIAKDENNYPTDSLTYRWWARYNLYHTLTLRDWIAQENDTLQDFIDDYENTSPANLEALGARMATMHPEYNTPDDFDYIENQITAISATHFIDSVTKKFLKIYLDYARDTFILGASESKFDTIARLCVFYNGPSVLMARDILARNNPELIGYNWGDSLCTAGGSGKTGEFKPALQSKQIPLNDDYRLHPNLLKDKLSARITLKEDEQGYVEIYSLQGKKLGIYNITEGTNQLDLSNLKPESGIYFYRVWVSGELKNNDKLIIMQ